MGATTYREMAGYAAQMPDDPGLAAMTARRKVVFSSTLEAPLAWANSEFVDGDAVEAVRALKQGDGLPLRGVGSVRLGAALVAAGLVDRLRVIIFPVITGATGMQRLFEGYPDLTLDLVDARMFDGRLQLLEYVPTVLEKPPLAD